jgi:predicted ATPase
MIAAFCTISENQIVCIEEPEIHLHRDSPDDSGAEVNILRFSDLPAR